MNDVTLIIERIRGGDAGATDDLLPIVYNELRRMAGRKLDAEAAHPTIQTTELVHEAYLRLVGTDQSWDGRAHFLAAAAEAMRRILVERARRRRRIRHGGGRHRVDFHESAIEADDAPDEILVVNDLLDHLAEKHPIEAGGSETPLLCRLQHQRSSQGTGHSGKYGASALDLCPRMALSPSQGLPGRIIRRLGTIEISFTLF